MGYPCKEENAEISGELKINVNRVIVGEPLLCHYSFPSAMEGDV